jgi:cytosine permease
LYFVLLGFTFFTATMFGGGRIGVAFPFFPDLVVIILVGNLLLGLYVAALAYISARSGLNTVLLSRFSFGRRGSALVDLLLGFTQIGWYAWGTATIAETLATQFELSAAAQTGLILFFGFAFCWTAYIGYRGLEILSWFAVPLMAGLIVWSLWLATRDAGGIAGLIETPSSDQGDGLSYSAAITIVFGTFASGGTQVTNWTRFARDGRTAALASLTAFFPGNALMIAVGAVGAVVYNQPDIVRVLAMQGLLVIGTVMLFLNIWTTQDNTIYNFSVAGCNLLRSNRRRTVTLVGAAGGTLLALLGAHKYLTDFLILLGVFIPPVGGVLMADFWYSYRGRLPLLSETTLANFRGAGLSAYALGAAAAFVANQTEFFIPPLLGVFVAAGALAVIRGVRRAGRGAR